MKRITRTSLLQAVAVAGKRTGTVVVVVVVIVDMLAGTPFLGLLSVYHSVELAAVGSRLKATIGEWSCLWVVAETGVGK